MTLVQILRRSIINVSVIITIFHKTANDLIRFFFYQGFLSRTLTTRRTAGEGGDHLSFHFTTSTHSQTFRHLFATLHVRWLSHIFNRINCIYQTATRCHLPPYRMTIWLIDDVTLIFCLFTWWFDFSFFSLQQFEMGNWLIRTRINYGLIMIDKRQPMVW